jgi:hypothetical protein
LLHLGEADSVLPFALSALLCLPSQATRQVTRAAIEWYGPDRPKFLGEQSCSDQQVFFSTFRAFSSFHSSASRSNTRYTSSYALFHAVIRS